MHYGRPIYHISCLDVVSYPMDTASESEFEMVSNTGVSSAVPSERDSAEENQDTSDRGIVSNLQMQNKLLQNEITALHKEMKSLSERNMRSRAGLSRYDIYLFLAENKLLARPVKNLQFSIK